MALLVLCFTLGVVVGGVGFWVLRKLYWRIYSPRLVRRYFAPPRYRRRVNTALRHRRPAVFRRLPIRTYAGYASNYRLTKLFDRLDQRDDD